MNCFDYGSMNGCNKNCPVLQDGKCEIWKSVEDFLSDIESEEKIIYGTK